MQRTDDDRRREKTGRRTKSCTGDDWYHYLNCTVSTHPFITALHSPPPLHPLLTCHSGRSLEYTHPAIESERLLLYSWATELGDWMNDALCVGCACLLVPSKLTPTRSRRRWRSRRPKSMHSLLLMFTRARMVNVLIIFSFFQFHAALGCVVCDGKLIILQLI